MFTLVTGAPRNGKTLYAVWELLRPIPGSTVIASDKVVSRGVTYAAGDAVPRRLLSNIDSLLLDHERLDAETMRRWPQIAQPGDCFAYDEAQELWRPRPVGSKVPEEIQAMETHGHMGIDHVVITQHPMLIDANLRRLVNRHLHVRRITPGLAVIYEWDHCGTPGSYRSCTKTRLWRYRKQAYKLYKSADLHTKTTAEVPKLLLAVGAIAVGVAAYAGPGLYDRVVNRSELMAATAKPAKPAASAPLAVSAALPAFAAASAAGGGVVGAVGGVPELLAAPKPVLAGCAAVAARCQCFDTAGAVMVLEPAACRDKLPQGGPAISLPEHIPDPVVVEAAEVAADVEVRSWMARGRQRPLIEGKPAHADALRF